MRRRRGAAPASAGAVPAVLAREILELGDSVTAHREVIRQETGEQARLIRLLAQFWTQRRIGVLLGVTESRVNQIIKRRTTMDEAEALEHAGRFPAWKPGGEAANPELAAHMRDGDDDHRKLFEAWTRGETIGMPDDLHYIVHGLLSDEAELIAAIEADRYGICPVCGRQYALCGPHGTTMRRHPVKDGSGACPGSGQKVIPGMGVER